MAPIASIGPCLAKTLRNERSVRTLAHDLSEGRKFKMAMTVAHLSLSQTGYQDSATPCEGAGGGIS
jgi:hypothetical protein